MHISQKAVITILICISLATRAQITQEVNPLLVHSNQPVPFNRISVAHINEAVSSLMRTSDERVDKITAIAAGKHSLANTLMAADELGYDVADLSMKLGLIASTFSDDSLRNAANTAAGKLGLYANSLYLNEGLYNALKQYASSPAGKQLPPGHSKFLNDLLISFEKNGMKLDAAARKDLQALNEKLINLGIEFDRNIAEYKDSIAFSEEDLAGVPANTKSRWKNPNGKYVVYVNGPNYTEVLSNADNEKARQTMYLKYNNRAYPHNIKVLDSLFYYRQKFAEKIGFKSYAEYALVDKMASAPANVWDFENGLVAKLAPHVTTQLKELSQLKRSLHPELADTVFEWDISYYSKKLLDSKYQLKTDSVKQYFEMNNTLRGMFSVYEKLFNLSIKQLQNIPAWHEKVTAYEMYQDGKKIGNFYLDLYPRPNKYTHFACFPISQYRLANGKELLPVAALVCNFPEGNAKEPSLLYHGNVITLFHEFGHLVHALIGRSDIASQGPFAVKGDFVEAPSQFLENWAWEYESLKTFARHYKTTKTLPKSLYDKMKQSQQSGSAIQYSRQLYLGMLDFTYEDKYDSLKGKDIVQVAKDLSPMRQIPFADGSHFICSFGHLNGYAANYYGYLWSRVFAEDMFSVFKKNGVMNTGTGIRYRREILEKASAKDEMDMLRSFLGREPNSDAFLESLGIKERNL